MIKAVKLAQSVLGVKNGEDAKAIYVGSDADEATKAYLDIARKGSHDKYEVLIWYGNGRLIKSCKLSPIAKAKAKKSETTEKSE